jgi:hypothetical protein
MKHRTRKVGWAMGSVLGQIFEGCFPHTKFCGSKRDRLSGILQRYPDPLSGCHA